MSNQAASIDAAAGAAVSLEHQHHQQQQQQQLQSSSQWSLMSCITSSPLSSSAALTSILPATSSSPAASPLLYQGSCNLPQSLQDSADLHLSAPSEQPDLAYVNSAQQLARAEQLWAKPHSQSQQAVCDASASVGAALSSYGTGIGDARAALLAPQQDRQRVAGSNTGQQQRLQSTAGSLANAGAKGHATAAETSTAAAGVEVNERPSASIASCLPKLNKQLSIHNSEDLTAKAVAKLWGVDLKKYRGRHSSNDI